jgi:U3 small nucleolar ribonucleoprotein protein LCP5
VDSLIEGRVVLEKIKVLEGRMKYQIEKLVKAAEQKAISADGTIFFSLPSFPMLIFMV